MFRSFLFNRRFAPARFDIENTRIRNGRSCIGIEWQKGSGRKASVQGMNRVRVGTASVSHRANILSHILSKRTFTEYAEDSYQAQYTPS